MLTKKTDLFHENQSNLEFALFFFYVLDLVYSSFRSGIYYSFSLTPNRRWRGASPTNSKILWMIQKKIYRQRRREARSRKPELVDSKVEADGSSTSPQATPPTSPKEVPLHQGMVLPEPERTIGELCTPDVRDLPIQNLDNIGVPFEIKT